MNDSLQQLGLPPEALPRHVAIVMDGNGRWAQAQGKSRTVGHARGAEAVLPIVAECARLGVQAVSLYALSTENLLRRPDDEVGALMGLYEQYLVSERQQLLDNNLRFRHIGRREGMPQAVLAELDRNTETTRDNTGMQLALALNYGSRQEITDAVRNIANQVKTSNLSPDAVDEQLIENHLYTAGMPEPDLLIRTAGEQRISNFLLWQISYAEIWVTDTLWPDFDVAVLHRALLDFARRRRNFGAAPTAPGGVVT